MKEQLKITGNFRIITLILTAAGIITFIIGLSFDSEATWASYLIANYYFLSLSIGAAFFLAIQSISQSGWSSAFRRVPEAMMSWIPVAAVFFVLLYFGMKDIYQWTHEDLRATDPLVQHKSAYLNIPFFFIRLVICFGLWSLLTIMIRRLSVREDSFDPSDRNGILAVFGKNEMYSRILIFTLAITFSIAAFDWIMSIETHWYSTIFAFKNFIGAFLHGVSIMTLIIFVLHRRGYFQFLNSYHLHDFARYIFILSIIWGYMWFAQFMIIWYGNIPEETVYYFYRWQGGWETLFWLQIILNWGVPFMVLLPVAPSRNMKIITAVIIILIIGQYVDLFVQVIPGVTGKLSFGWIEAGLFIGFAGLFLLVVGTALGRANLIPRNHPYLTESLEHQFE